MTISRGLPGRRQFLKTAAGASALALFDSLVPAWARTAEVLRAGAALRDGPRVIDLSVNERRLEVAGGTGNAVTVGNSIPGPLLEWYEGEEVVINVSNHLREDTSIHWHGILLPFEMDGVPGVTFRGIAPGTTFQYRFPVKQSGTYWYHSHSGLQEQSGMYGPLVVHAAEGRDPVEYDRDYVVMLSDWTFEDPHAVMRKLKKASDYYNFQQFSLADLYGTGEMTTREALATKLAWDRMRMMATDIADVTGATYSYLMNGLHPAGNWTGLFRPGERVRLRFINGSAMSYFNVRIPGLPMTVVATDGQNVQPVETDEFQIATAETYDVIVRPTAETAYTIMAESIDRSGYAAGTLATRPGQRAAIPPLRKRPLLSMVDMGMDHGSGGHEGHGGGSKEPAGESEAHAAHGHMEHGSSPDRHGDHSDHAGMQQAAPAGDPHTGMQHAGGHAAGHDAHAASAGPVVARHGPDHHGPGNAAVAEIQRDRLGERGTGLADVPHRVLVYTDLKRLDHQFDDRPPARDIELHLTGHMERYMWSFDGKKFHEVDGPIEFDYGERLRLVLVNDTMMNHPIHLHGMWLELENGHGRHIPRKHTINVMPASRVSTLITADAPGRWAFHCHLLYHMEMGMFRVVRVS